MAYGAGTKIRLIASPVKGFRDIGEVFIAAEPTPQSVVRHKCGRGHMGCVNPKHLEWGTRTQNQLDMAKHGTIARGANSSSCKLTGRQVLEIYANTGEDNAVLAARMGVSVTTLGDIRRGKSWAWLTKHGHN